MVQLGKIKLKFAEEMRMKEVAPTMQEIEDVLKLFESSSTQELQALGVFNDNRKMVIRENIATGMMLLWFLMKFL